MTGIWSYVETRMPATDVPFLDLLDPGFDFDSTDVIAAQAQSWYAQTPLGLFVLRHAEAQELLRDRRLNHNGKRIMEHMCGVFDGPAYDWFVSMIVNHDGDDHRRLRGLVNKAFTPRMIDNLRPFIRAKAEELTDRIASATACEFVEDFGNLLPLAVMCQLLGVPPEDYDTFRKWTSDVGLVFSMARGGDTRERAEAAVVGLSGYADLLIRRKEAAPADDLISALAGARKSAGQASAEELRNLVVTLVFAAHDTTRHQLGNAMVAFARHPAQWAILAERPELGEQAADEVVRWCPSTGSVYRFAAEDFVYHDLPIARDTSLMMSVPTAQRDPRVYSDGHTFDITIRRRVPALQFGGGPHHCLGAALARTEISEALPVLARRLKPPRIVGPVTWRLPIGIRGPNELPLSF
jgi:cytochrome P450